MKNPRASSKAVGVTSTTSGMASRRNWKGTYRITSASSHQESHRAALTVHVAHDCIPTHDTVLQTGNALHPDTIKDNAVLERGPTHDASGPHAGVGADKRVLDCRVAADDRGTADPAAHDPRAFSQGHPPRDLALTVYRAPDVSHPPLVQDHPVGLEQVVLLPRV